jgi:hypothetical protein
VRSQIFFVILLVVLTFALWAVGQGNNPDAELGILSLSNRAGEENFEPSSLAPQMLRLRSYSFMITSASPMPLNSP